jgi:hypothetical protein
VREFDGQNSPSAGCHMCDGHDLFFGFDGMYQKVVGVVKKDGISKARPSGIGVYMERNRLAEDMIEVSGCLKNRWDCGLI